MPRANRTRQRNADRPVALPVLSTQFQDGLSANLTCQLETSNRYDCITQIGSESKSPTDVGDGKTSVHDTSNSGSSFGYRMSHDAENQPWATWAEMMAATAAPPLRTRRGQAVSSVITTTTQISNTAGLAGNASQSAHARITSRTPGSAFYRIPVSMIKKSLQFGYSLCQDRGRINSNGYPKHFRNYEGLNFGGKTDLRGYPIVPGEAVWTKATMDQWQAGPYRVIFSPYGSFVGCTEKDCDDRKNQKVHRVKLNMEYARQLRAFRARCPQNGYAPQTALEVNWQAGCHWPDADHAWHTSARRATASAIQVRGNSVIFGKWESNRSHVGGVFRER